MFVEVEGIENGIGSGMMQDERVESPVDGNYVLFDGDGAWTEDGNHSLVDFEGAFVLLMVDWMRCG